MLQLTFQKAKLGIQRLCYIWPNILNNLANILKSANSASFFKYNVKKYFLKN